MKAAEKITDNLFGRITNKQKSMKTEKASCEKLQDTFKSGKKEYNEISETACRSLMGIKLLHESNN